MAEVKKCIGKVIELTGEELARAEYEYREKVRMDRAAEIEYGRQEGFVEGFVEGFIEGIAESIAISKAKGIAEGIAEERARIVELLKQAKIDYEVLKRILEENS